MVPIFKLLSENGIITNVSDLSLFTRADAIAMGCIFAINEQYISRLVLRWGYGLRVTLLTIFALASLSHCELKGNLKSISITIGGTHGTIANLLIGIMLIYSIHIKKGWWHKLLNNKIAIYTGTLSYSLYLWQQFFIHKTAAWYNSFPVDLLLIAICALVSYHFIEKPFLKLKKLI